MLPRYKQDESLLCLCLLPPPLCSCLTLPVAPRLPPPFIWDNLIFFTFPLPHLSGSHESFLFLALPLFISSYLLLPDSCPSPHLRHLNVFLPCFHPIKIVVIKTFSRYLQTPGKGWQKAHRRRFEFFKIWVHILISSAENVCSWSLRRLPPGSLQICSL